MRLKIEYRLERTELTITEQWAISVNKGTPPIEER